MSNLQKLILHGESYKKLKLLESLELPKDSLDLVQEKLIIKEVVSKCTTY